MLVYDRDYYEFADQTSLMAYTTKGSKPVYSQNRRKKNKKKKEGKKKKQDSLYFAQKKH